jgi:hypothetical protein
MNDWRIQDRRERCIYYLGYLAAVVSTGMGLIIGWTLYSRWPL